MPLAGLAVAGGAVVLASSLHMRLKAFRSHLHHFDGLLGRLGFQPAEIHCRSPRRRHWILFTGGLVGNFFFPAGKQEWKSASKGLHGSVQIEPGHLMLPSCFLPCCEWKCIRLTGIAMRSRFFCRSPREDC